MMTGKDGVSQVVEASATGLAQLTLTPRWGVAAALVRDLRTLTRWTMDAVRPAQGPDGLKTLGVVDEGLHVYPGASIAPGGQQNKCQLNGEHS
jgi:hypothetical protein